MTNVNAEQLRDSIGEVYRISLETAFQARGLKLADFIRGGVACFDVGSGREIAALAPLNPKVFVATEPRLPDFFRQQMETELVTR